MLRLLGIGLLALLLGGCAGVEVRVAYPGWTSTTFRVPVHVPGHYDESGIASFYHDKYQGRLTANGERFDQRAITAAHKSLPFGTRVRVTNINNGRSVQVRINDRGPFISGRIIDLTRTAFSRIEDPGQGLADVVIEVLN